MNPFEGHKRLEGVATRRVFRRALALAEELVSSRVEPLHLLHAVLVELGPSAGDASEDPLTSLPPWVGRPDLIIEGLKKSRGHTPVGRVLFDRRTKKVLEAALQASRNRPIGEPLEPIDILFALVARWPTFSTDFEIVIPPQESRLVEEGWTGPPLVVFVDPGEADAVDLARLYAAVSDLYRGFGGVGVSFRDDQTKVELLKGATP